MLGVYRRRQRGVAMYVGAGGIAARRNSLASYYNAAKAAGRFVKKNMNPNVGSSIARKLGTIKGRFPSTSKKVLPKKKHIFTTDKIEEDLGTGGQEWTGISRTLTFKGCGKKLKMTKMEKANVTDQVFRYSSMAPFMNTTNLPNNQILSEVGAGANWLYNFRYTNSNIQVPLHIYDLTCINNIVNGSVVKPQVGWFAQFTSNNAPSAGLSFYGLRSENSNGSLFAAKTGNWVPENISQSNNAYNNYPGKSAFQDWVSVNMLCYGAAKQATKFKIAVIKLKEDFLAPNTIDQLGNTSNLPQVTQDPLSEIAINTYESMVAPFCKHPINTFYYNKASKDKKFKVLGEIDFIQQPRLTTETDAAVGHCKQVKLFIPLRRTNRYDWGQFSTEAGPISDNTTNAESSFLVEQGYNNIQVHPKARVYLVVMATNTTNVISPAVPSVDYTPSYDIVIRTKYKTFTS